MSLFDISQIGTTKNQNRILRVKTEKVSLRYNNAAKVVDDIKENKTICYLSVNTFSMIELLETVIKRFGKSEVDIMTWSINEYAARSMVEMINTGEITNMRLVADWRIRVRKPEPMQIIENSNIDLTLTNCHAKTTVIRNDNVNLTIISSANYTHNPRIESGTIFTQKEVADFYKNSINEAIEDARKT